MLKKILAYFIVAFLFMPSLAEVKLKDVPANHWAAKSVYDLVKLGITSGYPDGTFRGLKNITRYEAAIFLSKLAGKMGAGDAEQIRQDIKTLKEEIVKLKEQGTPVIVSGEFDVNAMFASLLAAKGVSGKGPLVNYRLKTNLSKEINEITSLKIGLDTMDAGYYGGTRDLVKQMIDMEGKLKINPVDLGVFGDIFSAPLDVIISAGPGVIQHTDTTGIASSENGICYLRQGAGVSAATKIGETNVALKYLVRAYDVLNSGKVDTNKGELTLGYNFVKFPMLNNLAVELKTSLYAKTPNIGGPKDFKWGLTLSSNITPKLLFSAQLAESSADQSRGMMASGTLKSDNFIDGMNLMIKAVRIGAQYIPDSLWTEQLGETGYDVFLRPLENLTTNVDVDFSQAASDKVLFKIKGAARMSSELSYGAGFQRSRLTMQFGAVYAPAKDVQFEIFYRANQEPALKETTDLSAIQTTFKF
ncbi:MAG: outer membrane protein [Candidatus Saganbacteria bacterium]|uniref:Outer membrane protein n=1 Tax=Candidatus Saganbacteria bacterium TaxID=2575572 RepID=A0A833NYA3_UNCSA|nr:MAG: outer membrane protein [Candidatus Saganbacteria bacterium]